MRLRSFCSIILEFRRRGMVRWLVLVGVMLSQSGCVVVRYKRMVLAEDGAVISRPVTYDR